MSLKVFAFAPELDYGAGMMLVAAANPEDATSCLEEMARGAGEGGDVLYPSLEFNGTTRMLTMETSRIWEFASATPMCVGVALSGQARGIVACSYTCE